MVVKLKEKDMLAIEGMFIDAQGRGFQPPSMRRVAIRNGIIAGWLSKADSDFFSVKAKGTHIVFTELGKSRLVKRIADRYRMDEEDALHLVRTGNLHMVETAVQRRKESSGDDRAFQTAF